MQIENLLTPGRTLCGVPASSKKKVLEIVADFIGRDIPTLNANDLFNALIAREKLGSTGIGQGVAIPHCRIKDCENITGALIKLDNPVDFDAIDDQPVDLLFVLLVPEEANEGHLQALAKLAELFSQPAFCHTLRESKSNEKLYQAAISYQQAA